MNKLRDFNDFACIVTFAYHETPISSLYLLQGYAWATMTHQMSERPITLVRNQSAVWCCDASTFDRRICCHTEFAKWKPRCARARLFRNNIVHAKPFSIKKFNLGITERIEKTLEFLLFIWKIILEVEILWNHQIECTHVYSS